MGSDLTDVKSNGSANASAVSLPVPPAKPPSSPVITVVPRPSIDPHQLAHRQKLSKTMQAILGAEVLDSNLPLLNPTREIVAKAVGVSSGYVDAARRLTPEQRREVARGKRSLVERKALSVPAPSVEQRLETIVAELGGIGGVIVALNRLNK